MKKDLYFIALVPDPLICAEVKAFKTYAQEHFNSGRALRSPAHITLEPPFKWESSQINQLKDTLETWASKQDNFSVSLEGFEAFPPRVIFVDIIKNKELFNLQQSLKQTLRSQLDFVSDRPELPFHPHMTIAYKDLRKEVFVQAWAHFSTQEYQRIFTVKNICLLQHNGRVWEEGIYFDFKEKKTTVSQQ